MDYTCSLINLHYTVKKPSSVYPLNTTYQLPKKPITSKRKPKFSLSRSLSGINLYEGS